MLVRGKYLVEAHFGSWFQLGHYEFALELTGDRLSIPFAMVSMVLVGLIGAFSRRYLHREPGYFRFYFLLALFGAGVELVVLAGSLDLVFVGWEVVGLTSALLIAFFHERKAPVEHGLRAFLTYRFCDIGLLGATVWTHHLMHDTSIVPNPLNQWGGFPVPETVSGTIVIGLLLLWASMGKSAQVPLGGWLPRAMEGPTPSSAIFYGAISIHLGPYLLLRAAPLLDASQVVSAAVIAIGALTALHGGFVGRVQTDIKSALAYASMTQVGLIYVEIGLGFRYLALVHIVSHAILRSLQILRSPSLLSDYNRLEQVVGSVLPKTGGHLERLVPRRLQPWLYRHALERGYFDAFLTDWVVGTFVRVMRAIDSVDRRFTSLIAGHPKDQPPHSLRGKR
jgi:NADH:ubiquinone oxidoreductase subunit 5 (subunit L)/multisubunit Na+/H+ antiporter MnhA subunit